MGKNKSGNIIWRCILMFIAFSICQYVFAATEKHIPLPPDQAFAFTLKKDHSILQAEWRIAPGYFLYKDQLSFAFKPTMPLHVRYPAATSKQDKIRGQYEIYRDTLRIPIALPSNAKPEHLSLSYQGCSQYGFCYPPVKRVIALNSFQPKFNFNSVAALLNDQYGVDQFLQTKHIAFILSVFALFGLLLAFTPCVLPMIPILTALIVGQKKIVNVKQAFLLSLTYVLGSALIYAVAGVLAAELGRSLQVWLQQPWVIALMSTIFVLLALSLFDIYDLAMPARLQTSLTRLSGRQRGGHYFSVFCMGMLSTLIVSPCVTAPLIGVLLYIAQTGNKLLGGVSLFVMGLCMGVPLIIIGCSAGRWLPKRGRWMVLIKRLCGILMIVMAVVLFARVSTPIFMHRKLAKTPFTTVTNLTDTLQQLSLAKAQHQPVLLDFYANWCASCMIMDKKVFAQINIKQALAAKHYKLLRADLSANTSETQMLMTHFAVIAPPAILFFSADGKPLNASRIDGEVNSDVFLTHINAR